MGKRLPTAEEIVEIYDSFDSHPSVTKINLRTVLHVSVEVESESDRNSVYELEGKLLDENPDLLFDFHVTTK